MIIVLEVLIGIAVVVGIVGFLLRGRRERERAAMTERRVEAYIETIRREGDNPALGAMSDSELRDLLLSSAHNLRQQDDRRFWFLIGGIIAAFVVALAVGTENDMPGFGMALLVCGAAVYGLYEYFGRRMREPLLARGIDVERLRVE